MLNLAFGHSDLSWAASLEPRKGGKGRHPRLPVSTPTCCSSVLLDMEKWTPRREWFLRLQNRMTAWESWKLGSSENCTQAFRPPEVGSGMLSLWRLTSFYCFAKDRIMILLVKQDTGVSEKSHALCLLGKYQIKSSPE